MPRHSNALKKNADCVSHLSRNISARFSRKDVSAKKPTATKNLAAHMPTVPLTQKYLVAKSATKSLKFSGRQDNPSEVTPVAILL